jgi:hypothetical protein
MSTSPDAALLAILLASVGLVIRKGYKAYSTTELPLPPGPPSYPLIGQLFSMPLASEHTTFDKQGRDINSGYFMFYFI